MSKQLNNLKNIILKILRKTGIEVIGLSRRPSLDGMNNRFSYQSKLYNFGIKAGEEVLDVGSGGDPFPYATMLVDLHTQPTNHRSAELKTNGKPFKLADINDLPFENKSYDFVYCSHVLEHVDDPIRACAELVRVGRRGYVETPSLMTDALFCWADGMHKWFTVVIGDRLVFFEYDQRLIQGVRNGYWQESVFSKRQHPLQDIFFKNQEIFNNGLMWEGYFKCTVFRQDGSIQHGGDIDFVSIKS